MDSELERTFDTYWRALDGPALEKEYRFHPIRKFRFDRAHPGWKIAIELEGGTWTQGRHVRGDGFSRDCEKYNLAGLNGWTVFRFTSDMLANDPARHLQPVIRLMSQTKCRVR